MRSKVSTVEQRLNRELGVEGAGDRRAAERARDRHPVDRPRPLLIRSNGDTLVSDARALDFLSGGLSVADGIVTVPSYGLSVGGIPTAAAINAGDAVSLADHTDGYGLVTITPSAARAAGSMIEITFGAAHATADFIPQLTAATVAAASADAYFTGRTLTRWRLATANTLAAGVTYTWGFHIRG